MLRNVLGFMATLKASVLLIAFCLPVPASTAQKRCADVPIDVTAASQEELHLACAAAKAALKKLGRCGLDVSRRLQIHIKRDVRHPFGGPIFGLFMVEHERILVTRLANIPALAVGTPYSKVPPLELYRSLIVHEVIHSVLHQNAAGKMMSQVASEYLAYALQIESLTPAVRKTFLKSMPTGGRVDDLIFSDIMLSFNPYVFAARAYQHFGASADRCGRIRSLLKGEMTFIAAAKDYM